MSDIKYTIGAKDEASAPMQKVESSLDKLSKSTKKLDDTSKKSLANVSVSFKSLAKGAGVIAGATLAIKGLQAAWSAFTGSIASANAAFDGQVEAVKGLETALALAGDDVEALSAKFQKFAGDMQAITGVGDEVTLSLMKQASMLGISSDQLEDASKAAIGLAEATGKSLDESLKLVQQSLAGEFGALGEAIPAIRGMTNDTEKLAAVQALAAKGLDAKAASADRLAGMVERAKGAIGDMMEQVGALLAPLRMVAAQGIKYLAEQVGAALVPAIEWVQAAFENMQPVFDTFRRIIDVFIQVVSATFQAVASVVSSFLGSFTDAGVTFKSIADFMLQAAVSLGNGIIKAVTFLEVIFTNFGDVVQLAIDTVLLSYETYRADTEHLFLTTLPAYISWFGENFFNIIQTAFNAVVTVIRNHIQKIVDQFQAMWDFLASGGSTDILGQLGEIAGRSYLEGFESTITSLPEIAARSLTARESELQNRMGSIAGNLADQFNKKFNDRKISFNDMESFLQNGLGLNLTPSGGLSAAAGKGGAGGQLSANDTRLLTRGSGQAIAMEQMVKLLEQVATATKKTADNTEEIESMSSDHEPALRIEVIK